MKVLILKKHANILCEIAAKKYINHFPRLTNSRSNNPHLAKKPKVFKMSSFNLTTLKALTTKFISLNSFLDWVEQKESVAGIFTEDDLTEIAIQFNQLLDQLRQSLPSPDKLAIDIDDGWHEELKKFDESQDVLLDTLNSLAYSNHLEGELHDLDEKLDDLERKCETINKALVKLFISSTRMVIIQFKLSTLSRMDKFL